jgi:hypothetical protein
LLCSLNISSMHATSHLCASPSRDLKSFYSIHLCVLRMLLLVAASGLYMPVSAGSVTVSAQPTSGQSRQLILSCKFHSLSSALHTPAGYVWVCHCRSGRFGSGLVTLSRHPIIRHGHWRFASAGYATAISCGDFYAGKGGFFRALTHS